MFQSKNRHAPHGPPGKHVEHADNARLLLAENGLQSLRVDAWQGNISAKAIHKQRTQREPDAFFQLICCPESGQAHICGELFSG
ncbi:MAG: hypothetical protein CM15mP21_6620 [Hyphomicrobiales bacterium]|nr:MAG: hypothetical protein CM15mP21_6620 [Hyphomicrobiales bacterium]